MVASYGGILKIKRKGDHVGTVEHLNPEGLNKNRAFTNVIIVTGPAKTIYIGGQDAVEASGHIVGKGDIAARARQVMRNLETALAAAGATLEHVVKWNIFVVQGQPAGPAFAASQRVWGTRPNPPAITVAYVAALANPDFLIELDAIAVVP